MSTAAYRISQHVMRSTRPKTICTCEHPEPLRNGTACVCVLVCQRCRLLISVEDLGMPDTRENLIEQARFLVKDLETVSHRRRVGTHSLGEICGLIRQLVDRLETT